ncbi:hypothetical protein BGW38_002108 [Lunasporangiospora selenospora]|uniref:Uncharacterized protein n=1 Tax=Lunasporangiospora selenospora TaxID=979761 RepID=A0A9P6G102_9FUNG|nr:hypothetical protein BGW38_002108 [Lunasporangiospora selenospora]
MYILQQQWHLARPACGLIALRKVLQQRAEESKMRVHQRQGHDLDDDDSSLDGSMKDIQGRPEYPYRSTHQNQNWSFQFNLEALNNSEAQSLASTSAFDQQRYRNNVPNNDRSDSFINCENIHDAWSKGQHSFNGETINRAINHSQDDIWNTSQDLAWESSVNWREEEEEPQIKLDENTRYWAKDKNTQDIILPKKKLKAFDESDGQRPQRDQCKSWGEKPKPVMPYYDAGYNNHALDQQRTTQFWYRRGDDWFVLNQEQDNSDATGSADIPSGASRTQEVESLSDEERSRASTDSPLPRTFIPESYGGLEGEIHADDSFNEGPEYSMHDSQEYMAPEDLVRARRTRQIRDKNDGPHVWATEDEWKKKQSSMTQHEFSNDEYQDSWIGDHDMERNRSSFQSRVDPKDTEEDVWTSAECASKLPSRVSLPGTRLKSDMPRSCPEITLHPNFDTPQDSEMPPHISQAPVSSLLDNDNSDDAPGLSISQSFLSMRMDRSVTATPPSSTLADGPWNKSDDTTKVPSLISFDISDDQPLSYRVNMSKSPSGTVIFDTAEDLITPSTDNSPLLVNSKSLIPFSRPGRISSEEVAREILLSRQETGSQVLKSAELSTSPVSSIHPPSTAGESMAPNGSSAFEFVGAFDWLNQLAERRRQESDQNLAEQKQQWGALMIKQHEDSMRIQDFIETTAAKRSGIISTPNDPEHCINSGHNVKGKIKKKVRDPISFDIMVETIEFGQQAIKYCEGCSLKMLVDDFCSQYRMNSYGMAIFVIAASAITKKRKRLRRLQGA